MGHISDFEGSLLSERVDFWEEEGWFLIGWHVGSVWKLFGFLIYFCGVDLKLQRLRNGGIDEDYLGL